MASPVNLGVVGECLQRKEHSDDESVLSDILSSDSDESSLDEFRDHLEKEQDQENLEGRTAEWKRTQKDEEREKMFYFSIYIDHYMTKKDENPTVALESEGFHDDDNYDESTKAALIAENSIYVIDEMHEEKFRNLLKTEIVEDNGIEDLDGTISIKTMCERNFKTLRMDGPSRRVALLFSFKEGGDQPISHCFLHFMQLQKEKFPYLSGVLLYYPSGVGIHVVEGSEYILLMHFPSFFKSECFKKLTSCKVLAVEDLSAMKHFEHYSCYKGNPPENSVDLPDKVDDTSESLSYVRQAGVGLQVFMKYAYQDFPSVTEDNEVPPKIESLLPSKELLDFLIEDNRWKPGLREVKVWFDHLTSELGETDNAEFVWPPRSDMIPVHLFHPEPREEEILMAYQAQKVREGRTGIKNPTDA